MDLGLPNCTGHSHDHEENHDLGVGLRKYIDLSNVTCLNEIQPGMGSMIIKPYDERMLPLPNLLSPPDDPELLLHIPFTEAVTIHSISIQNMSNNTSTASPYRIKLFVNRDDLDFETVRELPPQQEIELLPSIHFAEGTIDYPCRPAGRFQGINSLTIFVVNNDYNNSSNNNNNNVNDDDTIATEITYVGFKGIGSRMKRTVVTAIYETQGMPEDHRVHNKTFGAQDIS